MDVSQPIASVIPSLDGPVLATLAGTQAPLSLREIHRLAGRGSRSGIRLVLGRLAAAGIVAEVPGGYLLNREHVAAPAIEALAALHGELAARIRAVLDTWGGRIEVAGLFGSAARRDGDESSDIDVLVVSDSPGLPDLVDDLAERIRVWTGNDAQVVGRTMTDLARLRRAGEPILASWARELWVLYGDGAVLRGAA